MIRVIKVAPNYDRRGENEGQRVEGQRKRQSKNLVGCKSVHAKQWLLNIHKLLWFLACLPCYRITPQSQQIAFNMRTNLDNSISFF